RTRMLPLRPPCGTIMSTSAAARRSRRKGRISRPFSRRRWWRRSVTAGTVKDLPATQREADYLDYRKRATSRAEKQSQALDGTVGFAASKGSALMDMARANIGQASVHGIWAYQGSKTFIDHSRLYGSMGDRTQS